MRYMEELRDRPELPEPVPLAEDLDTPGLDGPHQFPSASLARDALREYAYRAAELAVERDPLILGATAAGVSDSEIAAITGVARSTIKNIPPREPAVPIDQYTWQSYAELLQQRVTRLIKLGAHISDDRARYYLQGYCTAMWDEGESWKPWGRSHPNPYRNPVLHRAVMLQALVDRERAYRSAYPSRHPDAHPDGPMLVTWEAFGERDARERMARELRLLRRDGPKALTVMFTQEERDAPPLPKSPLRLPNGRVID